MATYKIDGWRWYNGGWSSWVTSGHFGTAWTDLEYRVVTKVTITPATGHKVTGFSFTVGATSDYSETCRLRGSLFTKDPTTGGGKGIPSGYIAQNISSSVATNASGANYTVSFTGLDITSATTYWIWWDVYSSSANHYYCELYSGASGNMNAPSASITESALQYHQTVYVRYMGADGKYGSYSAVIDKNYSYGATVSWSRAQDATYNAASVSYTVTGTATKYVDVSRRSYRQIVNVRYMGTTGDYGSYSAVIDSNYYYGASVSWSRAQDTTYNAASVSYSVTGAETKNVNVSRRQYTNSFNANGGGSVSPSTLTKYYGQELGTLPTVSRSYYNFKGWFTASSGGSQISTKTTMGTGTTYYAQWSAWQHTVAYNANGGTNAPASQTKTYGSTLTITTAKPTRLYYKFVSWNTKANGSGTTYQSGASYTADQNGGTITLYAQWELEGIVRVKYNGAWKTARVYVKTGGQWRFAIPYVKASGSWKQGIG